MKYFRKLVSAPFVVVGGVVFFFGVALRFGLANTNKILESLTKTVNKYKDKE